MDVDQAVATLMQDLPAPVQAFLMSEERARVMRDVAQKHGLHVDQAGEFEQAFLFMLLGISTPEEFVSSLTAAGIPQETVNGLAADVNERVFMPLRNAERTATETPRKEPAPKPTPMPPPAIEYGPAPAARTLPGSPVPAPMPLPAEPPHTAVLEPTPVAAPAQHVVHAMPQMHQPGWHPAAAVHIFVPTHGAPPHPAMQPPVQPVPPVPQPAPAEPAPIPRPAPQQAPEPPPGVPPVPATPIQKDYVADPYREPI